MFDRLGILSAFLTYDIFNYDKLKGYNPLVTGEESLSNVHNVLFSRNVSALFTIMRHNSRRFF